MAIIIRPFGEHLAGPWGKLQPRNSGRFKWHSSNNRYDPSMGSQFPGGVRRRYQRSLAAAA